MTELQLLLAKEGEFVHGGETYRVGPISVEVMEAWQSYLAGQAHALLLTVLPKTAEGRAEANLAVAKLGAAGEFDYFSESSQERMRTMNGMKKLILFRTRPFHPDVSPATIADVIEKEWEAISNYIRQENAVEAAHLPNDEAPATTGATSEPSESLGNSSSPS